MNKHEKIFLGTIIGASQYIDPYETSGITAEMFTTRHGKAIYNAIGELLAKNITPDIMTVSDIDKSIPVDVIAELSSHNHKPYIEHAIDQIKLNYKIRILKKIGTLALSVKWDNYQETYDHVMRGWEKLDDAEVGDEITTLKDFYIPYINKLNEKYDKKGTIEGVEIKFEKIASMMYGFENENLYYIGARPGEGKSTLLMNMAWYSNIIGKKVGYISIESSKKEFMTRLLVHDQKIPMANIKTGMLTQKDFIGLTAIGDEVCKSNIIIYDKPNASIHEVMSTARMMKRKHKIDILFIDYLQVISNNEKMNKTEQVRDNSTKLKQLARMLKIPVVCAAQLNRDADNNIPILRDFQHSSQIEQDADGVIFLYNNKQVEENQFGEQVQIDDVYAIIAKVRDGETGYVRLNFDKSHLTITEHEFQRFPQKKKKY